MQKGHLCKQNGCHYECMTCSGPRHDECKTCFDGWHLLNNTNRCVRNMECHYTCETCINRGYSKCTSCAANRDFIKVSSRNFGLCGCFDGATDTYQPECRKGKKSKRLPEVTNALMVIGGFLWLIFAMISRNPIMFFSWLDAC